MFEEFRCFVFEESLLGGYYCDVTLNTPSHCTDHGGLRDIGFCMRRYAIHALVPGSMRDISLCFLAPEPVHPYYLNQEARKPAMIQFWLSLTLNPNMTWAVSRFGTSQHQCFGSLTLWSTQDVDLVNTNA